MNTLDPLHTHSLLQRFLSDADALGVRTYDSGRPGPHIGIVAMTHGNEIGGLHAFMRLIDEGTLSSLACGRVSLILGHPDAFLLRDSSWRLSPQRYIDEDLNRVWDAPGTHTHERRRRDAIRSVIDECDALLDLHSTSEPSRSMIFLASKNEQTKHIADMLHAEFLISDILSRLIGMPLVEYHARLDSSHVSLVIEWGQHYDEACAETMYENILRFLSGMGVISREFSPPPLKKRLRVFHCHYVQTLDAEYLYTLTPASFDRIEAGQSIVRDGERVFVADRNSLIVMPTRAISAVGEEMHYLACEE